ncbi:MAG TPA: acetate--CoA ligase [Marmoricola sp.]|nr:acetate--CoA ligase [Marmoricola sp.]
MTVEQQRTRTPIVPRPRSGSSYDEDRRAFTWEAARARLGGLPVDRGLNIGYEAVDRHVDRGDGHLVALRCVDEDGRVEDVSYERLRQLTNRFAEVLGGLGVRRGHRVASLLGRQREQYVVALGTLKRGAVFCPLFSSFGPEPIRERLRLGEVSVLVTTPQLYRRKVEPIRDELPDLRHVLLVGGAAGPDTLDLDAALDTASPDYPVTVTAPDDPALVHFTSGTTGTPKGALHVHEAVVAHHATASWALDLHRGDVFWCTADPGWVTGTSYGIIAPLTHGATLLTYSGEFDADRWYQLLADHRVTVWYTAPTALRMLMRYGADLPRAHDLSALRHVASVGEALNPEVVTWGAEVLGRPVHDNWWQTETGAIMISNHRGMEIRPGSMGRPVPGIEAAILVRGPDGRALVEDGQVRTAAVDEVGELALRPGWPSMFRGYLGAPERYAACFAGGWYLSGDLARTDADGYFWFVGRADDVIKSAGHLVGPCEVETVLMEHPAVVEAGVIGKPDPVAGELVKAFVTLRDGVEPTDELRLELLAFGRRRLGGLAPKEVDFDQDLPHTSSGKVMRRLLKARELGLPEGDVSTLEQGR